MTVETITTSVTKTTELHRLFKSDTKLTSQEINDLLGIQVRVNLDKKVSAVQSEVSVTGQMFKVAVISFLLTAFALLGSMYQLKIGPFYQSALASVTGK